MRNKTAQITLSLDPDTKERLRLYAQENRKSVSQVITDMIWAVPLRAEQQAEQQAERRKTGKKL